MREFGDELALHLSESGWAELVLTAQDIVQENSGAHWGNDVFFAAAKRLVPRYPHLLPLIAKYEN